MGAGDVDVKVTTNRSFNCNVFDGVDDYVEVPHNAAQLGANLSNGFTISAWINPRSIGEGGFSSFILDKSTADNGANGFTFLLGDRQIGFYINSGTYKHSGVGSINYGRWTYVLVTISAGQLANFYINGVLTGTANQDLVQLISTINTTNAMKISTRSGSTDRTFDGAIRSVKMWNRVLTTAEIATDYAGGLVSSGLIHFFKLGGDYTDHGSVGVTATNSGSLPFIVDDNIAVALKAQRTGANDKFLISRGEGGQVITAGIAE